MTASPGALCDVETSNNYFARIGNKIIHHRKTVARDCSEVLQGRKCDKTVDGGMSKRVNEGRPNGRQVGRWEKN